MTRSACVLAVANQKGGVGKTTTVINLGVYLASQSQRVLLIDLDPQANVTGGLGFDKGTVTASIYEVILGQAAIADAMVATSHDGLKLVPSALRLAGAEVEMVGLMAREQRVARVLQPVLHDYDFVLIDCSPSLGLLTVNALTAASGVVIPIQCEYLALEALGQLLNTVTLIRDNLNPRLHVFGIVMTMFDGRTNLSQQVVEDVRSHFPELIFQTVVPRNIRLSEAPSFGRSIADYDPNSRGAHAYQALATEVIARQASSAAGQGNR